MKVINTLSDGTVRESMEGITIPADSLFYPVLAEIIRKREEKPWEKEQNRQ